MRILRLPLTAQNKNGAISDILVPTQLNPLAKTEGSKCSKFQKNRIVNKNYSNGKGKKRLLSEILVSTRLNKFVMVLENMVPNF